MGLGERTTKGGEVLREEEDAATVDGSVTSNNTVSRDLIVKKNERDEKEVSVSKADPRPKH